MDVHDKWGEKMSDLIRRSDAIEAIEGVDWYHQNSRNKDMVNGANSDEHQAWYKADDVYKALKEVPSADRPRGEWIEQEDDYHHYWECSECGMGVGLDDIRNFCPNCGSDNRERNDDE